MFAFAVGTVNAQDSYTSSQWSRYKTTQNVAYAGYYDYLTAGLLHKSQWVGWENAPTWQELEIQSPLKNASNAISMTYSMENFPTRNKTQKIKAGYTYIIKMSSFKTAFGLGLGVNYRTNNVLATRDVGDPAFADEKMSYIIPQAAFGVAFYNEKFHAGLSVPEFFGIAADENGDYTPDMSFSDLLFKITGGYNYNLQLGGTEAALSSDMMLLYSQSFFQIDINTIATINNSIIAGLGYRLEDAAYIVLGYKINRQFSVAYSYDYNYGLKEYSVTGSHVIGLVYDLNYIVKTANPRPF